MPNFCTNHVEIHADNQTIQTLQQKLIKIHTNPQLATAQYIDFNGIVPMPKSLDIVSCSGGNKALELINLMGSELLINTRFGEERFIVRLKEAGFIQRQKSVSGTAINQIAIAELLQWLVTHAKEQEDLGLDLELARQYMSNIIQYGHATWYEWCRENWGTKWNACNSEIISVNEDSLVFEFDTAWNYPEAWFEQLCAQYPEISLTVRYAHDSGDSAGTLENDNGCLIHYPCDDGELADFIFEHFGWEVEEVEHAS